MPYLLDTSTCIDVLRNVPDVIDYISKVSPDDCAISSITTFELFSGVEKSANPSKEKRKVDKLLGVLHEIEFNHAAAVEAALIRATLEARGTPIGAYDTLLAGHALSVGRTFVTSNVGEFQRVEGLRLENWRDA